MPAFHAAVSANSVSVTDGSNKSVTLNVTVSGGFNAAVAFAITGLPSGVSAVFTPAKLPAPGSGSSVVKLTATAMATAGTYSATLSATSGATKQQMPLSGAPGCALAFSVRASLPNSCAPPRILRTCLAS